MGSGFVISYLILCLLRDSDLNNLTITVIFTVVSITRTYTWRRIYETQKRNTST